MIQIFPNEAVRVRFVLALSIEFNDEWMEQKYLDMDSREVDERNCMIQAQVEFQNTVLSLQPMLSAFAGQV